MNEFIDRQTMEEKKKINKFPEFLIFFIRLATNIDWKLTTIENSNSNSNEKIKKKKIKNYQF